jgi:phosphogluconate dehydratase
VAGGPLARLRSGDIVRLDAEHGVLEAEVESATWQARTPEQPDLDAHRHGTGRELFAAFRAQALGAEQGAVTFEPPTPATTPVPPSIHDHFAFAAGANA